MDDVTQFGKTFGIGRLGDPKFQVSAFGILFVQMLEGSLVMAFLVELWIMGETELHRATNDLDGVNVAIGFCHNTAVDGTRWSLRRGTMVFGSVSHDLDLFGSKPFQQSLVLSNDACRNDVVGVATFDESRVVIGCDSVSHIDVDEGLRAVLVHVSRRIFDDLGKAQTLRDDRTCMVFTMGCIERSIAGQDSLLHVCHKLSVGCFTHAVEVEKDENAFCGLFLDIVENLLGVNLGLDFLGGENLLDHALFVHEVSGA